MKFQGLPTALVPPFSEGQLDEACFRTLVRRQIDGGVSGIVPCGTTGEAPTLTVDEHVEVVRWAVEAAAGEVPVMAGIGSNCTATAISTGKRAAALGVGLRDRAAAHVAVLEIGARAARAARDLLGGLLGIRGA